MSVHPSVCVCVCVYVCVYSYNNSWVSGSGGLCKVIPVWKPGREYH